MIDARRLIRPDETFRRNASGLLVPAEISREREVWTRDEFKLLDRVARFLAGKGVDMFFGCPVDGCKGAPIERIRNADGGLTLRCAHKDRVVLSSL